MSQLCGKLPDKCNAKFIRRKNVKLKTKRGVILNADAPVR